MPKFQQRHHQAVADLFWKRASELNSLGRRSVYQEAHVNEWRMLQQRFRNLFAGDNAGFKPGKFDRACGLDVLVRVIIVEEIEPREPLPGET